MTATEALGYTLPTRIELWDPLEKYYNLSCAAGHKHYAPRIGSFSKLVPDYWSTFVGTSCGTSVGKEGKKCELPQQLIAEDGSLVPLGEEEAQIIAS